MNPIVIEQSAVRRVAVCAAIALVTGCGAAQHPNVAATATNAASEPIAQPVVSAKVKEEFDAALVLFVAHDRANDWDAASCERMAKEFGRVATEAPSVFAEATFNAGVVLQRCGDDTKAKRAFESVLAANPKHHYARAQLARYQYRVDRNIDAAIEALQLAVHDAQFQNVPALVDLAAFQMMRDGAKSESDCRDDMECAKKNLQRALAIDDSYMPAFNQLALYYYRQAKKRSAAIVSSGGSERRANVQQLELAALVCSQAIRKNPQYAPIHNTAGLIQNELGQLNGAVSEFAVAVKIDPTFVEAQMNYAAVNLSFRGFERAQVAYQKVIERRPKDYEAHLGLALALRGQINDTNYDKQVGAVEAELATCKALDPSRPDAYYNEGILVQEYKAKGGGDKKQVIGTLSDAKAKLELFADKAAGREAYVGAVKRARERSQDIVDTIAFLELGDDSNTAQTPPVREPPAAASKAAPPTKANGGN